MILKEAYAYMYHKNGDFMLNFKLLEEIKEEYERLKWIEGKLNTPKAYYYNETDNIKYLIMEYKKGSPINQTIKNEVTAQLKNQSDLDNLMNKRQACDYLGISNNTLDSWIKEGLPVIRIGKTVRFNKKEVHRWLNNQQHFHSDLL